MTAGSACGRSAAGSWSVGAWLPPSVPCACACRDRSPCAPRYGAPVPTTIDDDLSPRSARLQLRLTPFALGRLREAADLRGQDVTAFVLGAALERAAEVVATEQRNRTFKAIVAEDPYLFAADPRIPDDPELAVFAATWLKARDGAGQARPTAPAPNLDAGWGDPDPLEDDPELGPLIRDARRRLRGE